MYHESRRWATAMGVARPRIAALVLLLAPGQDTGPTLEGVGPLHFGMTVAETARLLRRPELLRALRGTGCSQFTASVGGRPWTFMAEGGVLVRVDVSDSLVVGPRGARIGLTEDSVQALFGRRLRVRAHEYTDGHYLIHVAERDTLRRLVFETDGRTITEWRSGLYPQVQYVEGCS